MCVYFFKKSKLKVFHKCCPNEYFMYEHDNEKRLDACLGRKEDELRIRPNESLTQPRP